MNDYEIKVMEFHKAAELPIDAPLSVDLLKLRALLLEEELAEVKAEVEALCKEIETTGATTRETRAKLMRELADLQYVLSGFVVSFGLPMTAGMERLHQSANSRLIDGKIVRREDGKILKGPNFKPPVMDDLV
ncbi:MAG: hypothetical protein FWD15_04575 [Alphaproteobacteria bacterium]|nr:hypothetical protein [Alphaproteobacteria bacterium]